MTKVSVISLPRRQLLMILGIVVGTALLAFALLSGTAPESPSEHAEDEHSEHADEPHQPTEAATTASRPEHNVRSEHISLSTAQVQQAGIQSTRAQAQMLSSSSTWLATLTINPDRQAHVVTPMAGYIEQVLVGHAASVRKGQPLAVLVLPELIDLQADLKAATANLALAQQTYQRERGLWQQGISAKQDYLQAEHDWQRSQISQRALQQRLSAFGATTQGQGRYTLRAPMSGSITSKDLSIGEHVQPTDTLLTIADLSRLWLEIAIPSQQWNQLDLQQPLIVSSPTGQQYQARALPMQISTDPQTRHLILRAELQAAAPELRPNSTVNVEIHSSATLEQLVVAKSALQQMDGQTVVFIQQEKSADRSDSVTFYPQHIQLFATPNPTQNSDWVAVQQGLNIGMRYVTQGSFALKSELEKSEATHAH